MKTSKQLTPMTIFSKVFITNYLFCFITRLNSDVFLARITLLWTLWVWFKMQVLRYLSKPYFLPSTDQYYETLQPQPTAAEVCFYDPHVYPFLGADWESLSLSCWKTEKKVTETKILLEWLSALVSFDRFARQSLGMWLQSVWNGPFPEFPVSQHSVHWA